MPSHPKSVPANLAPLSEFDRALRAIAKVPKSELLKMERREKRKPVASTRKRKGK